MKVRLLESAHDTWAPAGTVGELDVIETIDSASNTMSKVFYGQFRPDHAKDHPLWIGRVKWEEVVDHIADSGKMVDTVKPRKRGK